MTQLIDELINDRGDLRAAPATPGLLNTCLGPGLGQCNEMKSNINFRTSM